MANANPNDDDDESCKEVKDENEKVVAEQTAPVFRHFVNHLYTTMRVRQEADDTPSSAELVTLCDSPLSNESVVGRRLAEIGDIINSRYSHDFDQMVRRLNLTSDNAYDAFASIARKLFNDGSITWMRIITVLCFGFRLAFTVVERGVYGFFTRIVSFVVRFVVTERIAHWISEQGGWRAILTYIPPMDTRSAIFIVSLAAISILAAIYFTNRK